MNPDRGHRVVASHALARRAFRLGLVFAVVAVVWAVVTLVGDGSWWGPLHAFLAGAVLLAISGASQMFTITWAAATPPGAVSSALQRWALAVGVGLVLVGVTADIAPLVWVGAAGVVMGLVLLARSITGAVRRSLLRRFDLSARFYLAAIACGIVGVSLGAILGSGSAGGHYADLRLVHSHLNLVGLVGLTIIGTLPTFLPTVAHHRAVSGSEARLAWWLSVGGAVAMATGLVFGGRAVGSGTVAVAVSGLVMLGGILVRLRERGRRELAFVQVVAGTGWLIVWALVDGATLIAGRSLAPVGGWTGMAVLAGVGQILAGSLSYLIPVLKGAPLTTHLRVMTAHGWLPLIAANLAGVALILDLGPVVLGALAVWLGDFAIRLSRVLASRHHIA